MSNLFRKSVIDKLSSPEQLDRTINITTPMTWILLIAFGLIILSVLIWSIFGSIPSTVSMQGVLLSPGKTNAYFAPCDGILVKSDFFEFGETFEAGDKLFTIEKTNGKRSSFKARTDGVMNRFLVAGGDPVTEGQELFRYSPVLDDDRHCKQVVVCYLPEDQVSKLRDLMRERSEEAEETGKPFRGLEAMIYPGGRSAKDAFVAGELLLIDERIASEQYMELNLGPDSKRLAERFLQKGPVVALTFAIQKDPGTGRMQWSRPGDHENSRFNNGTTAEVELVTDVRRPIAKLFGK